ncbi:MAG: DNA polymerase III subunit delta, partial [Oscillospiraceae bacterium]|nr:DNA polymerase III subunit delta [Oscillospiraceae bacterium]
MAKQKSDSAGFDRLKASIRGKNVDNLYVFHGEERFLMQHYLASLKKLLLDDLTQTFNFHRLNNENFNLQTFADAVENLPMMAEHTLVQVDDIDFFKLPEGEREKISQILSDIPEYCTVVLNYVTVAWKPDKRLKKLWEPFDQFA